MWPNVDLGLLSLYVYVMYVNVDCSINTLLIFNLRMSFYLPKPAQGFVYLYAAYSLYQVLTDKKYRPKTYFLSATWD